MTTIRDAKRIALDWVEAEAPKIPHFRGAFLLGSVIWKDDDTPQPATSDVDIQVVVDIDKPEAIKEHGLRQKYRSFMGITLETSYSPFQRFSSPESVLADFGYAAHFTRPNILADPTGELTRIQKVVEAQFTRKKWVMKRIEGTRDYAQWGLNGLHSGSFVDRMLALWFATSIAGLPIQADLRPPTIRKGHIVFQQVMKNIGRQDLGEALLKMYGSHSWSRMDVEVHLEELTNTFDRVVEIARSPSMGDYINAISRPVVIEGARELLNDGFHREAMVWIGSMRTICQQTILRDVPGEEQMYFSEQYEKLLAKLGLHSLDDFRKRAEDGQQLLEELMRVAEQIVETNPKIIQ